MSPASPLTWSHPGEADVLLREVRLLDGRAALDGLGDVRIRGGVIAEIGQPGALDAEDREQSIQGEARHCLTPAFFDPHVHLRTPGQEHKEDLETGTRAAAAGGFCGVIGMPNTEPVTDSAALLRALRDGASRDARVPVGFLPAITRALAGEELTEMAELRQEGALGFTDDGHPVMSAAVMRRALQYQRLCGGVIACHEEDTTLSAGGVMHEGAVSAALGLGGIPSVSESSMIERDVALAEYEQACVHFQHLSVAQSVRAVESAKARGCSVSAEVTPHHLLLTEEDVRSLDTSLKVNPPLAHESDRKALIEGLRSGAIDCVASDHAPHASEEKEVPFEQAPMGTTGLETAFAALYTELVLGGQIELAVLVERMSAGAALFGMPTPEIRVGARANLALLDLDSVWVPGEHGYESRSRNCAFAGKRLQARVLMTFADGAVAFRQRAFSVVGV